MYFPFEVSVAVNFTLWSSILRHRIVWQAGPEHVTGCLHEIGLIGFRRPFVRKYLGDGQFEFLSDTNCPDWYFSCLTLVSLEKCLGQFLD